MRAVADWENENDTFAFLDAVEAGLHFDFRPGFDNCAERDIFKQMKQRKEPIEFYDYLFGFDYLETKNLSVNSDEPGTRWRIVGSRGCKLSEDTVQDVTDQVVDGIGQIVGEGGTAGSRQAAAAWPAVSTQAGSWA